MIFTLKWLLPYWKRSLNRMVIIVVLGLFSAALHAINPVIVKNIINGMDKNLSVSYLKINIIYLLSVSLMAYIVGLLAQRSRAYMNMKIEFEIRQNLFEHILTLDHSLYYRHSVGDILTRLIDDISEKISWFACSGVFRFIQSFLTIIAVITAMLYINIELTIWALIPVPLILFFTIKIGKKLNTQYAKLQESISELYDFLETSFSAIRLIKANSKEKSQMDFFLEKSENQKKNEIETARLQIVFSYFFHYSIFMSIFLIYSAGGMMVINGSIDLGELVAFQFFSAMIMHPLMDISQFFISGNRAEASIRRIDEIFLLKSKIIKHKEQNAVAYIDSLKFEAVSFKPGTSEKNTLENISFELKKGQILAIAGKIGSGKSTVAKLIMRLMEYDLGQYLINNISVREITERNIRQLIAYVPQEASIFTASVEDNITLFDKNYDKEAFNLAIKAAQLEADIEKFPKGLNTEVGNRGFSISGGQKQRIAIARALLKKPEILVIDDATNAMDAQTEDNFWNDFKKYYEGCSSVILTHRTKTLEKSDMIIVLEHGNLVEKGNHKDLMKTDTLYKKIYERSKVLES